ncbi:hypothetical protein D3C80_1743810 [compost metagenome]
MVVAVVENVVHFQPFGQFRVKTEAGFDIVIVVGRNGQRLETIGTQGGGCGEDVGRMKGQMLHA